MAKRRPPIEGPLSYGRAGDVLDPGEARNRATPPGEQVGWRVVRGLFAAVAVGAGLVAAATGIWLWGEYLPPGPSGGPAEDAQRAVDAYGTAWVVLGLAAVAWLGPALVSSPASRRILATGALVAVAGGALVAWTGPQLAWDEVVVADAGPGEPAGLQPAGDVQRYVVDGDEVSPGTHEALLAGHVLGATLVAIGLLSGGLLARARRRRPDETSLLGG